MSPSSSRNMALVFALASLSAIITPAQAVSWVFGEAKALAISRIDPIVNPGDVAGHAHNIVGGSSFSRGSSAADLRASKCTSVGVQADKSAYWAPQLYYRYPDNTFAPMLGSSRVYYFNTADDIVPFPAGLKMLAGNTMERNASDVRSFGVRISCNHGEESDQLPNKKTHPGGCSSLTLATYFPSCGKADGSTDSDDHFSHMMWSHQYLGGKPSLHVTGAHCPESHPIHYPTIKLLHNYWFSDDQPWRNDDDFLVLSNGDTTGLAYHADFQNGWDQAVLKKAIDECNVGDKVSECAAFAPSVSTPNAWNCRLEGEIPAEDIGLYAALPKLPGCNPLWTADMPNTKPACNRDVATPGFTAPNSYFRNDLQRMNIPLTLPNATADKLSNIYRPDTFQDMTPKVGAVGASRINVWGSEEGAKYVQVGSIERILENFVNDDGSKANGSGGGGSVVPPILDAPVEDEGAGPTSAASSAPASASTSATATVTVTKIAPAATVTVVDKSCKRSNVNRLVVRNASDLGASLRRHKSRRSRRRALVA